MLLKDFIIFNPKEKIEKGTFARKISMDKIEPFTRYVNSNIYEIYNGGTKFKNGDTIMARITPCLENGKTSYISNLGVNEVAFGSTEFIVARAKKGVSLPLYVYYLLCSKKIRDVAIKSMIGSTGRERVQLISLEELEIPYVSLEEQQHIVNTIGSLDNLIEKYEEILAKLSNIKSLYYSKTIVNAKDLSTLLNFINIETGSMNLNENNPNGKYIFYTRNEGVFRANKYTHEQEGVIVAGEGNFTPKYANGKFGLHQRAYLIYSNNKLFSNKVLYQIIKSNVNYLNGIAVGSTVKSLRKNSFENMPFYNDGNYNIIEDKLKLIHNLEEQFKKLLIESYALKKQYLEKFFK